MQHQNELTKFVREEVGRLLLEQQRLEARHRHLVRKWDELVAQQVTPDPVFIS